MNLKNFFVGASTMLILFASSPQIFAEEIEVFGDEFETKPSQPADTSPDEVFTPPEEVVQPPEEIVQPPEEVVQPPEEVVQPPAEVVTPPEEVVTPPEEVVAPPEEISTPFEPNGSEEDDEDFDDTLNFNPGIGQDENSEIFAPQEKNDNGDNTGTITVITPPENDTPRTADETQTPRNSAPQKKLKILPQRFVQVAVDENYIYYLDKQSVSWKKIPYMSSEYMADVWVRMIEKNSDTSDMPADLAAYVNDTNTDELALAKANGFQYKDEDIKVLKHKKYFLERYYLRPQKDQIQFICELEVVGHPQNTASQRKYDYNNWEELIPGSIESILYYSIIQIIGRSKASDRGHMTFADMVEEYGRISIR